MSTLIKMLTFFFPWVLRRRMLNKWFRYRIHPNAKIGLSWVFPEELIMEDGAAIGHFNIAIHLDLVQMGANSSIGRGNWITGFPSNKNSKHFQHETDRRPELHLGKETAITKNHHLDCTNRIIIGNFVTLAGYQSQLLTHSIDIVESRQSSAPIYIGDYSFVGTNVVILGGSSLPSRSVLGAKSLLNKQFTQGLTLYGGVPAKPIQNIPLNAKYFRREDGFVF